MIEQALFSDGTGEYRIPPEPGKNQKVKIRFRGGKNDIDHVFLCRDTEEWEMEPDSGDGSFDFFQKEIALKEDRFRYYFRVLSNGRELFYDRQGVKRAGEYLESFEIVPGFSTPDWAKGAVMYQILVDRFCNGDPSNDVEDREYFYSGLYASKSQIWEKCPADKSFVEFYGGDLEGVRKKLDYLQKLGVEVIYFNPLFVSPSSHKYDIQDYNHIDPHYGKIVTDGGDVLHGDCQSNEKASKYKKRVTERKNLEASDRLFCDLVSEIHARGMRVILDGVFNHCGSFNKWLDREKIYKENEEYAVGAYEDANSPYHSYFYFRNQNSWPDNDSYEGWWDYDTLPKLNFNDSKELYQEILGIAAKWVSPPFNADGWRLDVAADLGHGAEINHRFWRDFRTTVKKANPQAVILAEHYGDPKSWLQGDQWDTIMNYDAFMEPVTWFLTGMEKHSDEYDREAVGNVDNFRNAMKNGMVKMLTPSLLCSMNELSNHDHSRFLTRTNHIAGRAEYLGTKAASDDVNKGVMREAVVIQMTWPGAPALYYGDEAGVCGFTDPDNRRTYPWGHEDHEMIEFHREAIRIHRENRALKDGSLKFLYGEKNILCFGRFNAENKIVTIVNNGAAARTLQIEVWTIGVPYDCMLEQLLYTSEEGFSTKPVTYEVTDGKLDISLPKHAALILKAR